MRTNLPVTQREHQLPIGETLLSTTDKSGHITYQAAEILPTAARPISPFLVSLPVF